MNRTLNGTLLAVGAALLYGLSAILITYGGMLGLSAGGITIIKGFAAAAVLLPLCLFRGYSLKLKKETLPSLLIYLVFCISGSGFFLTYALKLLPSGTGISLHFVYPFFVALAEYVLFKYRFGKLHIALLGTTCIGIFLLADKAGNLDSLGIFYAIISGIAYGSGLLYFPRSKLKDMNLPVINFYSGIVNMLVGAGYIVSAGESFTSFCPSFTAFIVIFADGILLYVFAYFLLQKSLFYIRGSIAALFGVLEPVSTIIMSIFFLNQIPTQRQSIACCLILVSVLALAIYNYKEDKKSSPNA